MIVLLIVLLIVVAAVGMPLKVHLSTACNQPRGMRQATREPHTWIMSFLSIGTFGSFIRFGFAFGQVLPNHFTQAFATSLAAASLTWLGPLLGSLIRPLGGSLADRFGGARITFLDFFAMALGRRLRRPHLGRLPPAPGRPPRLSTAARSAVITGRWLPDTPTGPATRR